MPRDFTSEKYIAKSFCCARKDAGHEKGSGGTSVLQDRRSAIANVFAGVRGGSIPHLPSPPAFRCSSYRKFQSQSCLLKVNDKEVRVKQHKTKICVNFQGSVKSLCTNLDFPTLNIRSGVDSPFSCNNCICNGGPRPPFDAVNNEPVLNYWMIQRFCLIARVHPASASSAPREDVYCFYVCGLPT